jgi:hypothetical protein
MTRMRLASNGRTKRRANTLTLFVNLATGLPDSAFADLFAICGQDGGLGEANVADPTVAQITYAENNVGVPTADRINLLVNTDFGVPIIITALHSDDPSPAGGTIAGNGATGQPGGPGNPVLVFYDAQQCDGSGIWAIADADGKTHIPSPAPIPLYHELSHALHFATGTVNPNSGLEEQAAEVDENVMRAEMGVPLRLVTDHTGGCGGVAAGGSSCAIVTAAYGTDVQSQVDRLRRFRDTALRATALGQDLFDDLHRQYYLFSPGIADDMRADPVLMDAFRTLLVAPLFAFYELACSVITGHPETGDAFTIVISAARNSLQSHDDTGHEHAAVLARALESLAQGKASQPAISGDSYLAGYLETELARVLGELPLVRWALVMPLAQVWGTLAGHVTPDELPRRLADWLPAWLEAVPEGYLEHRDVMLAHLRNEEEVGK